VNIEIVDYDSTKEVRALFEHKLNLGYQLLTVSVHTRTHLPCSVLSIWLSPGLPLNRSDSKIEPLLPVDILRVDVFKQRPLWVSQEILSSIDGYAGSCKSTLKCEEELFRADRRLRREGELYPLWETLRRSPACSWIAIDQTLSWGRFVEGRAYSEGDIRYSLCLAGSSLYLRRL
jgi:hypothetical protein